MPCRSCGGGLAVCAGVLPGSAECHIGGTSRSDRVNAPVFGYGLAGESWLRGGGRERGQVEKKTGRDGVSAPVLGYGWGGESWLRGGGRERVQVKKKRGRAVRGSPSCPFF